jgi:2-polyprenyl-3-methyl-5-hydroxy-6-metoxy-1,4-benzoquinol methylase
MLPHHADSHVAQVQAYFDTADYFQRRDFDIRIRRETVQEFTRGESFKHVLDVGCGNGAISIPLLERSRELTLLDVSREMLGRAAARIAPECLDRVRCVNADLLAANIHPSSCDLVLCLGVLAHVDDVEACIAKMAALLEPGGSLVLEITDGYHPVGRALVLYHRALGVIRRRSYPLNRVCRVDVLRACKSHGLAQVAQFRYALPPPGSHRIASQEAMYRFTRFVFGASDANRSAAFGNVFIGRFRKEA